VLKMESSFDDLLADLSIDILLKKLIRFLPSLIFQLYIFKEIEEKG